MKQCCIAVCTRFTALRIANFYIRTVKVQSNFKCQHLRFCKKFLISLSRKKILRPYCTHEAFQSGKRIRISFLALRSLGMVNCPGTISIGPIAPPGTRI